MTNGGLFIGHCSLLIGHCTLCYNPLRFIQRTLIDTHMFRLTAHSFRVMALGAIGLLTITAACTATPTDTPPATPTATATSTPALPPAVPDGIAPTATLAPVTAEPITLTLWLPTEFSAEPARQILAQQLNAFAANADGLPTQVLIKNDHGPGGLFDLLKSASPVAPRILPDLIALDAAELEAAARAGLLQPIGPHLPADLIADLFPFARDLGTVNQALYGIVYRADLEHLAFNTRVMDAAPVRWADILSSTHTYVFAVYDPTEYISDAVLAHYLALGGRFVADDGQAMLDQNTLAQLLQPLSTGANQRRAGSPPQLDRRHTRSLDDISGHQCGARQRECRILHEPATAAVQRAVRGAARARSADRARRSRLGAGAGHARAATPGCGPASAAMAGVARKQRRFNAGRAGAAGAQRRALHLGSSRSVHWLHSRAARRRTGPTTDLGTQCGRAAAAESYRRRVGWPRHPRRCGADGSDFAGYKETMTHDLRAIAAQLQQAALHAVDPAEAVYKFMSRVGDQLLVDSRAYALRDFDRIFVAGAGKAVMPMADAVCEVLSDQLSGGTVITKYGHVDRSLPDRIHLREAGHPVPDENSIEATRELVALLRSATPRDLVITVISGGGSALMTLPADDLSLTDVQVTTQLLLRAGATIHQINSIRKHLDVIKGGGLARLANGAAIITLILSDVIGDDLSVIASGPTVPDPSTFDDAWRVVEELGLVESTAGLRATASIGWKTRPHRRHAQARRCVVRADADGHHRQ